MRAGIVWTLLRREWAEMIRNRLLVSTIVLPPIILTVAPIVLGGAVGERALPPELVGPDRRSSGPTGRRSPRASWPARSRSSSSSCSSC